MRLKPAFLASVAVVAAVMVGVIFWLMRHAAERRDLAARTERVQAEHAAVVAAEARLEAAAAAGAASGPARPAVIKSRLNAPIAAPQYFRKCKAGSRLIYTSTHCPRGSVEVQARGGAVSVMPR